MAEGWTGDTMGCFEEALAQLAAGNAKAMKLSMLLSQAATLEEKQRTVAAWCSLAASITHDGGVAAAPQHLPNWFGLASFFGDWMWRAGAPSVPVREASGK